MNKKGQYTFDGLPKIALAMILAAVFFVIGIIILTSMSDNSNFYTIRTVSNESFTFPVAGGSVNTTYPWVQSVSAVKNTGDVVYTAANYTVTNTDTSGKAKITFTTNASICTTGATCGLYYTYKDKTGASGAAMTNALVAIEEIPSNWLLLMMTILGAVIVIGIVLNQMKGQGR